MRWLLTHIRLFCSGPVSGDSSTLCVAGLALYGLGTTAVLLRKRALSMESVDLMRLCLFASLVGALAQAMVDGVIVMPYSQLWLAIIVGWLLALHEWQTAPRPVNLWLRGLAGLPDACSRDDPLYDRSRRT